MVKTKLQENRDRASSWYANNKERTIARNRLRRTDNRKSLLEAAQNRARTKSLPIDITVEDIFIPGICPVLGIKLVRGKGRFIPSSPSLDRIDPSLGYIRGNVQVISSKANAMKSDASREQLLKFAEWVMATYIGSDNGY